MMSFFSWFKYFYETFRNVSISCEQDDKLTQKPLIPQLQKEHF